MGHNIFFSSDHHFGHSNILTFKDYNGNLLRPGFSSIEEHNEYMVERHNSVVKPQDKVYFLGDVVFNKDNLSYIRRMNGHKRLIRGNHDTYSTKSYSQVFEEVMGCKVLDRIIFTHIPIHPECLSKFICNVHGHLHANRIPIHLGAYQTIDNRYFSVCMEKLDDYKPRSLEEIKKIIEVHRIDSWGQVN